jgi:hypothetical protein
MCLTNEQVFFFLNLDLAVILNYSSGHDAREVTAESAGKKTTKTTKQTKKLTKINKRNKNVCSQVW